MDTMENKCQKLLAAINSGDIDTYVYTRISIVAEISDNDYFINENENGLVIGKALVIILGEMSHKGIVYKRVVLVALYSLLKVVIDDKEDNDNSTAIAFALLLILFSENQNFIGGEYIVSKVKTVEIAAKQHFGMLCVFYWKYYLNGAKPTLLYRTQQRLQNATKVFININVPDISVRKKVIDFEYDNFKSMVHDMPIDIELKYPGIPYYNPETDFAMIRALFNEEPQYFKKHIDEPKRTTKQPERSIPTNSSSIQRKGEDGVSNSGCMVMLCAIVGVIILAIYGCL